MIKFEPVGRSLRFHHVRSEKVILVENSSGQPYSSTACSQSEYARIQAGKLAFLVPARGMWAPARGTTPKTDLAKAHVSAARSRLYWAPPWVVLTDEGYSPAEILTLARAETVKREASHSAKLARAQAVLSGVGRTGRAAIPDDVKIFVWQRDNGCCVQCGSRSDLEYDHIIPFSLGGSSGARNLQLLCSSCNSIKGGRVV